MLTACLDESYGSADGFYVVGGYLGGSTAWRACSRLWKDALYEYGLSSLHIKELRLGSTKAEKRYKTMLERFGSIPAKSGLCGVYGSVTQADYADLVNDTIAQIPMNGYPLALWALIPTIFRFVPPTEHLKLVFEQQTEHAAMRQIVLSSIAAMPQYKASTGRTSRLVAWDSVPKTMLLEPADYLCYAVLQDHLNKTNQKARLTKPILVAGAVYFSHMEKEYARTLVSNLAQVNGLERLTKDEKKGTMQGIRGIASAMRENPMSPEEYEHFEIAMTKLAKADDETFRRAFRKAQRGAKRKRGK